jgi:integrase/recombinase XerD
MIGIGVAGPLEPFRVGIEGELDRLGYSQARAGMLMLLVAHVSAWMDERHLAPSGLTDEVIGEFFAMWSRSWCRSPQSFAPALAYLRTVGAAPAMSTRRVGATPSEVGLWESFGQWCVGQRGLKPATADKYIERAETCLRFWRPEGELNLGELDSASVLAAVRAAAAGLPGPSFRCAVTALRSLLRFLHATGRVQAPLVEAVPALKRPTKAIPSLRVPENAAEALVASCDLVTAIGRRDAAVVMVLARLGLRANEVASLGLDDIDWRRGEMAVAGKGGKVEVVPLPVDVGEALARYLRKGRPPTSSRALFVKQRAPFGPLTSNGIGEVVGRSCKRARLPRFGPHQLRHLVATVTLRSGASLVEVAQLLRHNHVETTTIYASADPASVAALARPWPEVAS